MTSRTSGGHPIRYTVKLPYYPRVLVAQWIATTGRMEGPPGVRKVMGPIPVGNSDLFFVPRSCYVDQFTLHMETIVIYTERGWRT